MPPLFRSLAAAALCLALLPTTADAEPQPWMKRDDFEALSFNVGVDGDCPFTVDEIEAAVKAEALRARIIPVIFGKSSDPFNWQFYMDITATCLKDESVAGNFLGYAMSKNIHFATVVADIGFMYHQFPNRSGIASAGKDGKGFLINFIRESVADLLTDYLEANLTPFD